ncbi:MAG: polysaccharide biosynthesis tyrosine autokinase [Alcaligenaceae bacterium]|nr:polysaccharide biosynthesis tyrosine autokinase [Alcaligenaceae bacterium SAGV5]MPS55327.1 polysaccharide biosynthesis tyrosine autokinase [Alcaligenaceae bacterium SAGV3]MPT57180.1 polysaccharide biosynthesis tyrosine autokinase [Alcaligenaceae bacterium]
MTPYVSTLPLSQETMGEVLIRTGRLNEEQVGRIIGLQSTANIRFGEAAIQLGLLSEREVQDILANQFNYARSQADGSTLFAHLAIARSPYGKEAEAIRQIRAGIAAQIPSSALSYAFTVVSPEQGEGKSYLAASLAVAFSQAGKRTLLVNGNLRESGQTGLLASGQRAQTGLSTILAGRSPAILDAPLPDFPALTVLDAGPLPPNPTELLLEPALKHLLKAFSDRFELFVIDSPAANRYSDAQIIARQTDGYVSVVRRDLTSLDALQAMRGELAHTGAQALGSIYNASPNAPANRPRRLFSRRTVS